MAKTPRKAKKNRPNEQCVNAKNDVVIFMQTDTGKRFSVIKRRGKLYFRGPVSPLKT